MSFIVSKKEMLDNVGYISGQRIHFKMPVEFDQLINNTDGISYINSLVDDFVEDGYLLQDLNYFPEKLEGETIIISVDALTDEWLIGDS